MSRSRKTWDEVNRTHEIWGDRVCNWLRPRAAHTLRARRNHELSSRGITYFLFKKAKGME